jgi:S-adenosylmethionine-diacylglycerol 3-amino-3-carboxypropyl transferase
MSFFENLNFTSSNEDGRSELAGLAGPLERMICLTGSGTRPLDMLLSGAEQVVAIDLNAAQNALLRLKIAAMRVLDQPQMLVFLGIAAGRPLDLWPQVSAGLAAADRDYWQARLRLIGRGIWYAGLWEKVLRLGARGTRLIRGRAIERLFAAATPQEQAAIWARDFDDRLWRGAIRMLGRPWVWTHVIGEPGGAFLPSPAEVERRLAGAFTRAAGTFLFAESDFASLILRGKAMTPDALPLHLLAQNYGTVQARLDRITARDMGLHQLQAMRADAFSLSDFGSYCTREPYEAAWRGILAVALPQARFVERVFMNPIATSQARVVIDQDLSTRLTRTDRAIIYDIRAGRIAP